MSLTAYRVAVQAAADAALADVYFVAGKFDGPSERAIGCCYPVSTTERANVYEEELMVAVRVFRPNVRSTDPYTPLDPAPLEVDIETLKVALDDNLAPGGVWLMRVVRADLDLDTYGIELQVMAVHTNPFRVV